VQDALNGILRIPAPREAWDLWAHGNPLKLLRYWQLRLDLCVVMLLRARVLIRVCAARPSTSRRTRRRTTTSAGWPSS
jgi:hypothetical protein